jgi:acyl dehydratase
MSTTVQRLDQLPNYVGQHLGYSPYMVVTQERVQTFADATDDHQWIHLDTERAKSGPFGVTIAHGYLTLSLVAGMMPKVWHVEGVKMGVNYGLNKVRFMSPVPVGSSLRCGAKMLAADKIEGGYQVTLEVTFEVEGATKPACVAEVIFRYYG